MIQADCVDNSTDQAVCRQGKYRAPYIHCSQQAPILQSSDLDFLNQLNSETEVSL